MREEIKLCRAIAKIERVDLKIGMYVYQKFSDSIQFIYKLDKENKDIHTVVLKTEKLKKMYWNNLEGGWLTPIWQEVDCIRWLREKSYRVKTDEDFYVKNDPFKVHCYGHMALKAFHRYGENLHIALLKAVLYVMLDFVERK